MVTIRDVEVILTAPAGSNLVVVKVHTSEPGLYGLGCATFTQRYLAVRAAVLEHLKPLVLGRDVDRIEDLWHTMMVNGYWRNGPVLNNAIAGLDIALWDIKGKRAGMPLYDLLGGRCRPAAAVYRHADGQDVKQVEDRVRAFAESGVGHIRVQMSGYGGAAIAPAVPEAVPPAAHATALYDPRRYTRSALAVLEHIRGVFGDRLEIIHDVHERLTPTLAVEFARECEKLRLFYLEDALAPEDLEWFARLRQVCTTPLAMGELFNHPREWTPLITGQQIDYLRMHLTQMGGLTPARKVTAMAELHGIRTAWHGPGDVSPVGHALNVHLDLASPNFGIQEFCGFPPAIYEAFPGAPEQRGGLLYVSDRPGLGVDLDEKQAARYPCNPGVVTWTQCRWPDGSPARP